jgi:DNA-binding transcriptional MerR regulator
MLPDTDNLDLLELAKAAGVTPRTIRYYVQQGLLPSPGRGPGSKYDRNLVERLQLIKLLQRQHLPLAEIRRRLEEISEEGVREQLGGPPELPLSDSALSYVHAALSTTGESLAAAAVPLRRAAPQPAMQEQGQPYDTTTPAKWQVTQSTWERIRLTRDVELNIRRPLSREQNKQVDELIDTARKIFSEDS